MRALLFQPTIGFGTILLLLAWISGAAANDVTDKAATCAACHGADGNSINPEWPNLAGQHASYIAQQLKLFKEGTRQNASMAPMVANLSSEDMQALNKLKESHHVLEVMTVNTAIDAYCNDVAKLID